MPSGSPPAAIRTTPAAWQQIDPARGRQPEVAGLPGGFAVMLEPINAGRLFAQRLEGAAWSPPVGITTPSTTSASRSPATPRAA